MAHAERVAQISQSFDEAMGRFLKRVEAAPPEAAERAPDDGGWSVAQIAWHVGTINDAFAGLIDGTIPKAQAAPPDFVETPFGTLAQKVPPKFETADRFRPPAGVTLAEAVERLEASHQRLRTALAALPPARGPLTIESILGLITVYQVGEWATAHVIRHNQQAKRTLGA